MVDAIYSAAAIKLPPIPIAPGPQMTTFEMFARHSSLIYTQRQQLHAPTGLLTAGHKKDVVISAGLTNGSNVAIYGWHQTNGKPIQPLDPAIQPNGLIIANASGW